MDPPRSLPPRPSIEHLRNQAKSLLRAYRSGDVEIVSRIRGSIPRLARASETEVLRGKFSLHDAQLILAREYGFQDWAALGRHVERTLEEQISALTEHLKQGEDIMINPEIIEKDEFTVVGLEAPFIGALSPDANNFQVIGPLWGSFFERVGEVQNRIVKAHYGVISCPPESERSHPHECQYLAGVLVSEVDDLPDGMTSHDVPATTFAVFTHRGLIDNLPETLHQAYKVWLPQSGYKFAGLEVEQYDERFSPGSQEDSEWETWIAVTRD